MSFMVILPFVVLVGALLVQVFGQSNLLCYDCDPRTNNASCQNPVFSDVSQTNCDQHLSDRHVNSTLICVSAFINFTGSQANDTGVYRGCYAQDPSVTDICDWLKEETDSNNGVLTNCVSCNTTRCNSVTFDSTTGSGASKMALVSLSAVLGAILFVKLF